MLPINSTWYYFFTAFLWSGAVPGIDIPAVSVYTLACLKSYDAKYLVPLIAKTTPAALYSTFITEYATTTGSVV